MSEDGAPPGTKKRDKFLSLRFEKDPSVVTRKIADELILVPIRQKTSDIESIYTVNEVASRIWELVDGERRVSDIRDAIIKEFDVPPEEAETDLIQFLQKLVKVGAVKEA